MDESLTAQRTAALRLEFANNHRVALASVVHALLLQTVLAQSRDDTCLDIVLTSKSLEASMKRHRTALPSQGWPNWRNALKTFPGIEKW